MANNYGEINNFADLISTVGIEIPLIQRDYVQGRVHDTSSLEGRKESDLELLKRYTDEREKRDNFVSKLVAALAKPQEIPMQLTFIYGTMNQSSSTKLHHEESLEPLDGQQRLTTLLLLSKVLLCCLDSDAYNKLAQHPKFDQFIKGLRSVKYSTRPSSSEFCKNLFSQSISVSKEESISEKIKGKAWFADSWLLDPTVQAMLQMLEQMKETVMAYDSESIYSMAKTLLDGKGIAFELLDMKDYKLTDGLYIKMNARGKQLTVFENWKSEFIGFLGDTHPYEIYENVDEELLVNVFCGVKPTFKQYFEYSIEHQWTDLFWIYCQEDIKRHKEELSQIESPTKKDKDCYPIIDSYFMNCFYMIHQLFYFTENRSDEPKEFQDTLAQREKTFSNPENVRTLFAYLDLLKIFTDRAIYDEMFFVAEGNQCNHPSDKIRLFDSKDDLNLLTRCAKGKDFTNIVEVMLFGMLKYAKKFGTDVTPVFKSFVRQVRNLAEGEYFMRKSDVAITNTLKISQIYQLNPLIDELIEKISNGTLLNISDNYAEIDDLDFCCGNLYPALLPRTNDDKLDYSLNICLEVLKTWDAMPEIDKIRLLVAYGFKGIEVLTCSHGTTYLYGNKNRWKNVFMRESNLEEALRAMLNDYVEIKDSDITPYDKLRTLLHQKKEAAMSKFGFRYYMLQYEDFVYAHAKGKDSTVYYSIRGSRDDLDICAISYSSQPVRAYHTDPMVYAVKCALENISEQGDKIYMGYSAQGADRAMLCFYNSYEWDGTEPFASLRHVSGTHGLGGWKYINHYTGETMDFADDELKDRVVAGVEAIKSIFPNKVFCEKR